jgi:hypothetical protein
MGRAINKRDFLFLISAFGAEVLPLNFAKASDLAKELNTANVGDVVLISANQGPIKLGNASDWKGEFHAQLDLSKRWEVGVFLQSEMRETLSDFCIFVYQSVKYKELFEARGTGFFYDRHDYREFAPFGNTIDPVKASNLAKSFGDAELRMPDLDVDQFLNALNMKSETNNNQAIYDFFHAELQEGHTYDLLESGEYTKTKAALSVFPTLENELQDEEYIIRQAINYVFHESINIQPICLPVMMKRSNRIADVAMKIVGLNSVFNSVRLRLSDE